MPFYLDVSFSDSDEDETEQTQQQQQKQETQTSSSSSSSYPSKNCEAEIRVVFHGIKVSSETEVVARIQNLSKTKVKHLRNAVVEFCVKQQQQPQQRTSSGLENEEASRRRQQQQERKDEMTAMVKLNFGGSQLNDNKMTIKHAISKVTKSFNSSSSNLPKLFVSGTFMSKSEKDAASFSSGGINAHNRSSGGGFFGSEENRMTSASSSSSSSASASDPTANMSEQQAEAMANMMASNPALIEQMLNMDPSMREMMKQHPEIARQLRDPDTIRDMIRSQSTRTGRAMQDSAMRAALSNIQNIPGGKDALDDALGREGIMLDDGPNSLLGQNMSGEGTLSDLENASRLENAPLLPGGNPESSSSSSSSSQQQGLLFPTTAASALSSSSNTQQQHQQQQEEEEKEKKKKKKIESCVSELKEMGFEEEMAELASQEAEGDLDRALALIEEWQT